MGKIILFENYFQNQDRIKGGKMHKKLLKSIREKNNNIEDMPSRAKEVLDYFQIHDYSLGVPIVEILTKMGFKIFQSNLEPDGLSAYIAVNPKYEEIFHSNKITCVHAKDNIGHKRFALAHELAHYLFDFDESKSLCFYDTYFASHDEKQGDGIEPREERANKFAANLLMPKDIFLQKFEEYKKSESKVDVVNALARYFQVSVTAVLRRFSELKIEGYDNEEEI